MSVVCAAHAMSVVCAAHAMSIPGICVITYAMQQELHKQIQAILLQQFQ